MESMIRHEHRDVNPSRVPAVASLVALVCLGLSACGDSTDAVAADTTVTVAPTTTIPPTTTITPTSTTSTTVAPVTTTSTTTTSTPVVQQTEPIAPPADAHGDEPLVQVGSIAIPKLGVDMAMYEGIRLTTLDYGPGHWPGTALPGQVGNVVVGGHRSSKHRVFRDVDQLVAGDEIIFRDANGEHVYVVNRVEIVEPTALWIVDPTPTATATLFACHPPGSTAQRIVVFADLAA
jgi:sortase A